MISMSNVFLEQYGLIAEKKAAEATINKNALATHRSNVNEYLLASELAKLAGHKDTRPGEIEQEKREAKAKHDTSKLLLDKDEYRHQAERAKHMALAAHNTYKRKGIDLKKATSFHVSATGGALGKITGSEVKSSENTSDVVAKIPGKKGSPAIFPGISAKSNIKSTEGGGERISNIFLSSISNGLGKDWHEKSNKVMDKFAKDKKIAHLPLSSVKEGGGRKEWLRKKGNEKHLADAEEQGNKLRTSIRDDYVKHLTQHGSNPENKEGVEHVRQHLLNQHFRSNASESDSTPFIVVSGHGTNKNPEHKDAYGAHAHFMDEHPHVEAIKNATHFTTGKGKKGGDFGFNVYAHTHEHPEGVHVLKLDTKWNSQPMASGIKIVGSEGSFKPKAQMEGTASKPVVKKPVAKKVAVKKPVVKKRITEGYELSGDDAFQMLTLGTDMDDINLNENHKNYLKDSKGNVRIFTIRGAAAKEAHVKGGKVVPYGRGYAVLLEENQNDYHVFEKFIRSEGRHNGGQETSSGSTFIVESTSGGRNSSSGSEGKEISEQSNAERKSTLSFKEVTARKIDESKTTSEENEEIKESIDKGIEPGLSMATSGENMMRGAIRNKALKKPLEELTGDETTASIGDQKEDELKKAGISLKSFKKRNYV